MKEAMELKLVRRYKGPSYTIGSLYINDSYFCDTIEDVDRKLSSNMSEYEIKSKKVYGETAIPTGKYNVTLNVVSPKLSKKQFYLDNANKGRVPRLLNVPGYDGILIHTMSTANDSYGCIGVGFNKIKGGITQSRETFKKLYPILQDSSRKGEKITIEII